jgi:hypothetical protein
LLHYQVASGVKINTFAKTESSTYSAMLPIAGEGAERGPISRMFVTISAGGPLLFRL